MKKNKKAKKILWLVKWDDSIYDYQVIATNSDRAASEVWTFYNKRANCENFIKEAIYSFGLDNVISSKWAGNNTWFQLIMLCYNILNWFKEYTMNQHVNKNFAKSIRRKLFIIPAKLIKSAKGYILKLERSWLYKDIFLAACIKLE